MRNYIKLSLLGSALLAVPAQAGHYCGPMDQNCSTNVVVSSSPAHFDDMLVSVDQPMGHLRSIDYRRSPHVSITRIHGMGQTADLSDHPSAFTGTCAPESTQYCRAGSHSTPQPHVEMSAPVIAAPMIAAPVAAPVYRAPVMAAPIVAQPQPVLRQWTASYDDNPARFTPRQYGSLDFVPGIAHVPSSWVDRDPARAQAALNASGAGGIAPGPQIGLSRIPDGTPGPMIPITQFMGPRPVQPGSIVQPGPASMSPPQTVITRAIVPSGQVMPMPPLPAPVMPAPIMPAPIAQAPIVQAPVMSAPVAQAPMPVGGFPATPPAPVKTSNGLYASGVAADGTYWEKVSGPTRFGDTIATQVICKRALPTETINPVVGVPTPVPYPVECGPTHVGHSPAAHNSRYTDGLAGGQWIR